MNLDYSFTIVNKYQFQDAGGNGPLESLFDLSNGAVDLMRFPVGNLQNLGLNSPQTGQPLVTDFTSTEYGRFLLLT